MIRVRKISVYLCLFAFVFVCSMMGVSAFAETPTLRCDTTTVTVQNGKSTTVTVYFENTTASNLSGTIHNTNIFNASFGASTADSRDITITGCGSGISKTTVYLADNPDISIDIQVKVTMSSEERKQVNAVQYISDRSFFFYDDEEAYVLSFSLLNAEEERIKAPVVVDIRIVNDDDVTVFEDTRYVTMADYGTWTNAFYGERLLGAIYIKPEEITEGATESGSVFFSVYQPGYWSFDESKVSASELPKVDITETCSLTLPVLPKTLSYSSSSGKVYSKVNITGMTYEFEENYNGTVTLNLYFTGQKTYDYKGENNSSTCKIGWKLYDAEGFVVKSGTAYTTALETDEKFKNCEESIYGLEPGSYTLKLINVE